MQREAEAGEGGSGVGEEPFQALAATMIFCLTCGRRGGDQWLVREGTGQLMYLPSTGSMSPAPPRPSTTEEAPFVLFWQAS